MTDLERRYTGPTGEVSARFRAAGLPPAYRTAKGTTGHFLLEPHQTGRAFSLYRWDMSARSSGPGPHVHRTYA